MTLGEAVRESLSDDRPTGPGPRAVTHASPDHGWSVTATAEAVDSIGCRLTDLTATRTGPAPEGDTVRGWADRVAERATGLAERLKVVEVDEPHAKALLRSDRPTARGENAEYYEAVLTGTTEATLNRYRTTAVPGGPREQVPFALTHESLAKLVDDMTG